AAQAGKAARAAATASATWAGAASAPAHTVSPVAGSQETKADPAPSRQAPSMNRRPVMAVSSTLHADGLAAAHLQRGGDLGGQADHLAVDRHPRAHGAEALDAAGRDQGGQFGLDLRNDLARQLARVAHRADVVAGAGDGRAAVEDVHQAVG